MTLLNHLLSYFMFAGTSFFATGASVVGGGSGAPAGGAAIPTGGDGGTGGDTSSTSGGSSDALKIGGQSQETASGEGSQEQIDDFGSFDDPDWESADDVDGPTVLDAVSRDEFGPDTYQKLKKALAADPELFKTAKKGLSMLKRFTEHFESPEKAGELLGKLTTLGGIEGIEQEMGETATFLNGWNAGDGEVISKWLQENGEGLPAAMPTILEAWRKGDEAGWAHDHANVFMATMNHAQVGGISALAAFNELSKIPGVAESEAYKRVQQVLQAVQRTSETEPEKKVKAKDDGQITAREQQVRAQEQNLRKQALGGKAAPILNTAASAALKTVIGGRKLSGEQTKQLLSDIHHEFARLAAADTNAANNRLKLLAAGQDEQWLKMVKSTSDRHMQTAARRVWRRYAGIGGLTQQQKEERKAEGQSRREAGAGTVSVSLTPESPGDGRQVDWDRMRAELGGRDKADEAFSFGLKSKFGGKRFYYKKGDKAGIYTY